MGSRLVLWDIDHTLIESGNVGRQVYAEAFAKVTGHQLDKMPELAGRTEPVIFRDALRVNGIEASEDLYEKFAAAQAQGYLDHLDELHRQGRALPGAREALEALAERDDVTQSVLTGNTRPAAEIKLRAFGLDRYINFDIGAYGTDDDTRANLVGIARQRAEEAHAQNYQDGQTVMIGDTSNDVAAALDSGAKIIAVATGNETAADLAAAGADTVLTDLTYTTAVVAAILGTNKTTVGQSPHAKLDAIIRQARYLLFDFDGPIRSMSGGNQPDEASDTAPPAPYIHDVLAACHESDRFAVVICTAPSSEVLAYLDAHDLFTRVTLIAASIGDAITELEASPSECAFITSTPVDAEAAQAAGVPTIAYAKTRDDADHQAATGATVVYSLVDLALSLRARSRPVAELSRTGSRRRRFTPPRPDAPAPGVRPGGRSRRDAPGRHRDGPP
jgi:phosphoglycolate phosphatase